MSTSATQSADSLAAYFETERSRVDAELDRLLPGAGNYPESIHRAMRYSVFAGGKRLRPILCLEAGRLFGGEDPTLLPPACALELIHTYSLVHDDLPALDDDDLRRGKPACHKEFGEATAILAGDALLTLAFEIVSGSSVSSTEARLRVIHELACAIGTRGGMVAGQVMDLESVDGLPNPDLVQFIDQAKTGSLLRMAVRTGAILAGASETDLTGVTQYGAKIGLAFQIADDLLDVLGSKESLGKAVGKDDSQHKATYPALYGVGRSREIALELVVEACDVLRPYGERSQRLQEIARYLVERNS
ncbi:MAG: polyprenyl synthetase family protein [Terriglobia bacterium]